jgi:hypothetical protein
VFFGNDKKDITYLVLCSPGFKNHVLNIFETLGFDKTKRDVCCLDNVNSLADVMYTRFYISKYADIDKYDKILYLDTDILIGGDLDNVFNLEIGEKIYGREEGTTGDPYHGSQIFASQGIPNPNAGTISCGVMLFKNCEATMNFLDKTNSYIAKWNSDGKPTPCCMDQSFLNYLAIVDNCLDNQVLNSYVSHFGYNTIVHFPAGIGNCSRKIDLMVDFMNNQILKKSS